MQARPQAGLQGSTAAHFLTTLFILSLWDGRFCFCLPNLFSITAHQNPLGKALLLFGQTDTATLPPLLWEVAGIPEATGSASPLTQDGNSTRGEWTGALDAGISFPVSSA